MCMNEVTCATLDWARASNPRGSCPKVNRQGRLGQTHFRCAVRNLQVATRSAGRPPFEARMGRNTAAHRSSQARSPRAGGFTSFSSLSIFWGCRCSSLSRNGAQEPALTHTASGLLIVCALELLIFGLFFGLSWLASRATCDELLLRWRGKVLPILLGAGYSVGLRALVAVAAIAVAVVLVLTGVLTLDSMQSFVGRNEPSVENAVDIAAMRDNPAYFWLTVTLVSFGVAGLREELWRASFMAGLRGLWPRAFGSKKGQVFAVVVAAIVFGLAHIYMGVIAVGAATVLGLGLGLIMVFHRSIWPAVLAHGFFDATTMALLPWAYEKMHQLLHH